MEGPQRRHTRGFEENGEAVKLMSPRWKSKVTQGNGRDVLDSVGCFFKVCEIKAVSLVARFPPPPATIYCSMTGIENMDNWIQLDLRFCHTSAVKAERSKELEIEQ